ncbi:MAG: zinc ABC transporter permease [Flavobacteriales bacterium]|nr:zinc ABC transporter permease [Flavobacteriales bacterium]|tara:strand:- start:4395 stop:5693 length:1299 start_codon:yes stop_codon:yes gene_type:complete
MSVWNDFIYFFSFQDANITNVLFGTLLLGFTCGIVGVLVVLNKKALIVDAVSHSILPGICIGFMLSGIKSPVYLISGGMAAGALSVFLVDWISKKSRIKKDAAIAITLSVLFSVGVILLNIIQHSGNSNQSGLSDFLFGKAATIIRSDLYVFGVMCAIVLVIIPLFYQHFKIALFDSGFAKTIGLNEKLIQSLISGLIIISTAIGIQTVGIILMSALIITPASSAFFWTNNFKKSIIISGVFAAISSVLGVFVSYLSPDMPTGPWIIVMLSTIAILSSFFSKKGILTKRIKSIENSRKMISDNVLKAVYKLGEKQNKINEGRSIIEIKNFRPISSKELAKGLRILKGKGLIFEKGLKWTLSERGIVEAKRIIRIHRLWELYMEKFMQIPSDHVHESAESIEHIMTPELETELLQILGKPKSDPHQQKIPYED